MNGRGSNGPLRRMAPTRANGFGVSGPGVLALGIGNGRPSRRAASGSGWPVASRERQASGRGRGGHPVPTKEVKAQKILEVDT